MEKTVYLEFVNPRLEQAAISFELGEVVAVVEDPETPGEVLLDFGGYLAAVRVTDDQLGEIKESIEGREEAQSVPLARRVSVLFDSPVGDLEFPGR